MQPMSTLPNLMQCTNDNVLSIYTLIRSDGTVMYTSPLTLTTTATAFYYNIAMSFIPNFTSLVPSTANDKIYLNIKANPVYGVTTGGTGDFDTLVTSGYLDASYNLNFHLQFFGTYLNSLARVASISTLTITLVTSGDTSNFAIGQNISFASTNSFPVATSANTTTVTAIGTGTITVAAIPSGVVATYYIFNGSALYAATRVSLSTTGSPYLNV